MARVVSAVRGWLGIHDEQNDNIEVKTKILESEDQDQEKTQRARAKWSKSGTPEITLETQKTETKWPWKKPDLDLPKAKDKLLETLSAIKALPAEVKEKVKFLKREEVEVEVSPETSEASEGDIDEYEIIELHEHIFLLGGAAEDGQMNDPTTIVDVYDCVTKEWWQSTSLPKQTTACTAAVVMSIPALIVSGGFGGWKALNTVQMFDFVTKEWSLLPHSRKRRWGSFAACTDNGIVLAGGCDSNSVLQSVELYNFKKREWYTLPAMQEPRCNFAGALIRRKLYVAGGGAGFYFNSAKASAEMFDGVTGKWTRLPPMKHKRYGCAAIVWKSKFIVLGGCDKQGVDVLPVEALDLEEKTWSELPPMPVGTSLCRAVVVQNQMVALSADGSERTVYAFDFERNEWEKFLEIPHGRNAFAVGVVGV